MDQSTIIIPTRILVVGVGEGGTSLGAAIVNAFNSGPKKNSKLLALNLSSQDIAGLDNLPSENILKLGGEKVYGAGKDNVLSGQIFNALNQNVISWIVNHTSTETEDPFEFIFVVGSTSGGTGSGIMPKLTAILTSSEVQTKIGYKTTVMGIAITPDLSTSEGTVSFENTVTCLEQIDKLIGKEFGRFAIVDNGCYSNSTPNKLAVINSEVSKIFYRYFCKYRVGNRSLDKADRISLIKMMGLHAFGIITNNVSKHFTFPYGTHAKSVGYEVLTKDKNIVDNFLKANGIVYDYNIGGEYEREENEELTKFGSVMHVAGFSNIKKIAEKYRIRLQQIKEETKATLKAYEENSTGLDNLDEEMKWKRDQYSAKQANGVSDILTIL